MSGLQLTTEMLLCWVSGGPAGRPNDPVYRALSGYTKRFYLLVESV